MTMSWSRVIILVLMHTATAWKQTLNFNQCLGVHYVNEDQTYELKWSGETIFSPCKVTFHGYDQDNVLNEYKVCIYASTWAISDPSLKLQYFSGDDVLDEDLQQTYTKYSLYSPTFQWCSDSDDYVDVSLITSSISPGGTITLQVTATMTYNYYHVIGWSVGGGIAGVAIFSAIIVTIIIISCRRRRIAGTVYTSPQTSGNTIITQSGSQQMTGGFGNQNYSYAPPSYYSSYPGMAPQPPATNQQTAGVHQQKY